MSWTQNNNSLHKIFEFKDFTEAMAWMVKAAFIIEKMNHHPKWTNMYNTVEISLSTHEAGNTITNKDYELAAALDELS